GESPNAVARLTAQPVACRRRDPQRRQSIMIASRAWVARMSGRFSAARAARVRRYLFALVLFCACLNTGVSSQTVTGHKPKKVLALHVVRRDSPTFDDTFRAELNDALKGQLDYY